MEIKFDEIIQHSHHSHCDGSNFRLKDCIIKVEQLVDECIKKGHSGVTLTDHETVALHIRIEEYVEELKKKGKINEDFKLVLGNEIYLVDSLEEVRDNYKSGETKFPHFILLAKDLIGHKQMRQLSSQAWHNSFRTGQMERVPTVKSFLKDTIDTNKGHLIASTACVGGEFMQLVSQLLQCEAMEQQYIKEQIHKFIKWNLDLFSDDFYIEIQPTNDDFTKQMNLMAIKIADAYKIKTIITTDSHYQDKNRAKVHETYLKSKEGDREIADFYATTYIMTSEELWDYFKGYLTIEQFAKFLHNSIEISNKVESYSLKHETIVPEIPLGKFEIKHLFSEWYDECGYIKNFANSEYQQDLWWLKLIENGFLEKGEEFNQENIHRINTELKELWEISIKLKQKLSSYYNLVEHIINIMWDDNKGNSFVGVARGSVTGYYTAYLVSITQMNPIKWDLPHWRHLEATRPELPDADLDSEAEKRQGIFSALKKDFGFDRVLNIVTFKTEGSKSALLTACRGLGINDDDAQFMADLIPFERGASWTLKECLYGNEDTEREPQKQFINLVAQYPELEEVMLGIEGLIVGRSIHASGVYVFKDSYIEQNALMKAPNGSYVTQWNMNDSDKAGGLKFDCLTIEALDRIRVCMELLLKYKKIEWQGSWRKTYNKYIHPDVIDYDSEEMWDMIANNDIEALFQFVTPIGVSTAKIIKPKTLTQLANANSLMRLMADESGISPVEIYAKHKEDIGVWYEEMKNFGLMKDEIKTLEKYLLSCFGVADTQEVVMRLSMDEKISGFDLPKANKLRKGIAKKNKKTLEEVKAMFFTKGKECGTRTKVLEYVWNVQIKRQLGYSFSLNHTAPYSNIAIQEMNLAYHYNPLFWNCACLSVDSGAIESDEELTEGYVPIEDEDEIEETTTKDKTTNYGKVASAIGNMQKRKVNITLPDINKAFFGFTPYEDSNEIVFGLKGIVGIGDDDAKEVVLNRPYESLMDFHKRMVETKREVIDSSEKVKQVSIVSTGKVITLIKAGAFDRVENKDRLTTMKDYLTHCFPPKKTLDMRAVEKVMNMGFIPEEYNIAVRIHNFRSFIIKKENIVKPDEKAKTKFWYRIQGQNNIQTERSIHFFTEHFLLDMKEDVDYYYDEEGFIIIQSGSDSCAFQKIYKQKTDKLKQWLNSKDCLERYNRHEFNQKWEQYAEGTISKWEMDSISFYYHDHELKQVDQEKYGIVNFDTLPEIPIETGEFSMYKGRQYPRFELSRLCGTVLDKNKTKHTVSFLTPDGVVLVKFQSGAFANYDKQISIMNDDGTKTVLEKGWFSRGTKLLITGYRRNDQFKPKIYKQSVFQHTVCKIENLCEDGVLELQLERLRME